ncbi:stage VI sporulation protein D [Bacillus sp. HMF5848]|uniref:stage VI sporulation protein D n=1 Tax=Bacillus sp. HMF5848 TaxID=2495421 RepID=UPI000F7AB1C1|nr:stage VI sporulation protein D [Bacillus sp. HMF5848]RSK28039.1 stage VI sporulation protein D [Bacillus sp. HMF5848]
MTDQNSYLRFSVEESVWFQKGQEVAQLVSISLDPDIAIHEHEQYISIRGALQLTGEYQIDEQDEEEEYIAGRRYVQEVRTREDGNGEMAHRFPVDITIPKNRIQNLEDVYVSVDSFDYELPSSGCLQLTADISISGIYGTQQSTPAREEEHEEELSAVSDVTADDSPQFTSNSNTVIDENDEVEKDEQSIQESSDELEEQDAVLTRFQSIDDKVDTAEENSEDLTYTPFEVEARKEAYEEVVYEREEEIEDQEEDEAVLENDESEDAVVASDNDIEEDETEENEENEDLVLTGARTETKSPLVELKGRLEKSESASHAAEQDTAPAAPKKENTLYLTKLFAREEEDEFTRMRICIVQQGESLEHICERYDVSMQSLLRVNNLESDLDVSEGQLLYIPTLVKK